MTAAPPLRLMDDTDLHSTAEIAWGGHAIGSSTHPMGNRILEIWIETERA